MRRSICLLLALLMILTGMSGTAFAVEEDLPYYDEVAGGYVDIPEATELAVPLSRPIDAIQIRNWSQLQLFLNGHWPSDGYFYLYNDITVPAPTFISPNQHRHRGRGRGQDGQIFTGTFDGNGHTIRGLQTITRTGIGAELFEPSAVRNSAGFIRAAGNGAVIRDLSFANAGSRPVLLDENGMSGALDDWNTLGQARSGIVLGRVVSGTVTIQNVRLEGPVEILRTRSSTGDNDAIGGFVGGVESGATLNMIDIRANSLELRSTNGRTGAMGGVIGLSNGAVNITASNSAQPNVIAVNIRGGGSNAVNNHDNDNPTRAGGVIGNVASGHTTISDTNVEPATNSGAAAANRQIRARVAAGGVVGWTGASGSLTIRNVTNEHHGGTTPRVSAIIDNARVGGIVGHARNNTRLENVTNRAEVGNLERQTFIVTLVSTNNGHVGGLVGRAENTISIIDSTNEGQVRTFRATPRAGGIIGVTTRATTLTNVTNLGNINHMTSPTTPANLGGIIGRSEHRLTIDGAVNRGNVTGTSRTGAGTEDGNNCHVGGIVGDIRLSARQNAVINNVINTGNINGTGIVTVNTENATARAGGIVGNLQPGSGASLQITDATNWGSVRALLESGGIIGRDAAPNTRITGAVNNGQIHTIQNQRIAGGIVGNATRAGLLIRQSGNNGEIVGLTSTLTGGGVFGNGNTESRAGFGGIIGRSAGNHRVEESFNAGFVRVSGAASNPRTGGIVGQNRGNLLVQDAYNIGDISGTGTGNPGERSRGSGIVGERTSGNITIQRAFVAGNIEGQVVAQSNTAGPGGSVTGIRFNQVYVDRTATRVTTRSGGGSTISNPEVLLQGNRAGVTLVDTELMTSGLLPGLNRAPWAYGIADVLCDYQRTYPFLAWQTNGRQEPQFFGAADLTADGAHAGIRPTLDSVDPATAVRNVSFYNVQLLANERPHPTAGTASSGMVHVVRTFNAYTRGAHAQRDLGASAFDVTVGENNPISIGLITPNSVVGFAMGETPRRFQAIGVDANVGVQIDHALFTSSIQSRPAGLGEMEGLFLGCLEYLRELIESGAEARIYVEAVGYHPAHVSITLEQLEALEAAFENGDRPPTIEIPMEAKPIDVQVWVRRSLPDDLPEDSELTGFEPQWVLQPASLIHTNRAGNGTNIAQAPARDFILEGVYVQELLTGSAPQFSVSEVPIDPGLNFRRDADNRFLQENGRYVIDIFLDNVSLGVIANVQVYGFVGYDEESGEPLTTHPLVIGTAASPQFNMIVTDPSAPGLAQGRVAGQGGSAAQPRRFTIGNTTLFPTENTAFQIVPATAEVGRNWLPSAEIYVVDVISVDEDTGNLVSEPHIRVFLQPVRALEIRVVERMLEQNQSGDYEESFRLIPDASLYAEVDYDVYEAVAGAGGIFSDLRVGNDDRFRASAPGFDTEYYTVWEESELENNVLFIILNQTLHELVYDDNGGIGGPGAQRLPAGNHPVNRDSDPTRAGIEIEGEYVPVVFVGWSRYRVEEILEFSDDLPELAGEYVEVFAGGKTLFAVWGIVTMDDDGRIPDVLNRVSVFYNTTSGNEDGPATEHLPRNSGTHTLSAVTPTHDLVDDRAVAFYGWSLTETNEIFAVDAAELPTVITTVEITTEHITVYAVWVYEAARTIIIDVEEDASFTIAPVDVDYIAEAVNGNLVITLLDEGATPYSVRLPNDDWSYETHVDEHGNRVVTIIPPEGYEIVGTYPDFELRPVEGGFIVRFNANGGAGEMVDMTGFGRGDVVNVPASAFTRPGHVQVGWFLDCPVEGAIVLLNGTFIIQYNATLYPRWGTAW